MEAVGTFAIGVDLRFVSTADGGRATPLRGGSAPEHRFSYRPNWGLPGWGDGEQTAGPVLGFSAVDIQPGDTVRAVLVPTIPDHLAGWRAVRPGDVLRMYEGPRICGFGTVAWVEPATWPMPADEREHFTGWLLGDERRPASADLHH
ncbi:hypothetical protein BWI15_33780 [Kribbella sp. ALI-6-A]|uniref:hypothetical protein n=1 Tax=Kribbella sp. ALI-6-A TaxID=1933817 RepID=UPI00097C83C0|nr:hypothetical protein [Kribbella sp. ALI-6-A]ONI68027.1 hypothetical protein BWI15_33780 [Kribbella sp. ALI-6-A]